MTPWTRISMDLFFNLLILRVNRQEKLHVLLRLNENNKISSSYSNSIYLSVLKTQSLNAQ